MRVITEAYLYELVVGVQQAADAGDWETFEQLDAEYRAGRQETGL